MLLLWQTNKVCQEILQILKIFFIFFSFGLIATNCVSKLSFDNKSLDFIVFSLQGNLARRFASKFIFDRPKSRASD